MSFSSALFSSENASSSSKPGKTLSLSFQEICRPGKVSKVAMPGRIGQSSRTMRSQSGLCVRTTSPARSSGRGGSGNRSLSGNPVRGLGMFPTGLCSTLNRSRRLPPTRMGLATGCVLNCNGTRLSTLFDCLRAASTTMTLLVATEIGLVRRGIEVGVSDLPGAAGNLAPVSARSSARFVLLGTILHAFISILTWVWS